MQWLQQIVLEYLDTVVPESTYIPSRLAVKVGESLRASEERRVEFTEWVNGLRHATDVDALEYVLPYLSSKEQNVRFGKVLYNLPAVLALGWLFYRTDSSNTTDYFGISHKLMLWQIWIVTHGEALRSPPSRVRTVLDMARIPCMATLCILHEDAVWSGNMSTCVSLCCAATHATHGGDPWRVLQIAFADTPRQLKEAHRCDEHDNLIVVARNFADGVMFHLAGRSTAADTLHTNVHPTALDTGEDEMFAQHSLDMIRSIDITSVVNSSASGTLFAPVGVDAHAWLLCRLALVEHSKNAQNLLVERAEEQGELVRLARVCVAVLTRTAMSILPMILKRIAYDEAHVVHRMMNRRPASAHTVAWQFAKGTEERFARLCDAIRTREEMEFKRTGSPIGITRLMRVPADAHVRWKDAVYDLVVAVEGHCRSTPEVAIRVAGGEDSVHRRAGIRVQFHLNVCDVLSTMEADLQRDRDTYRIFVITVYTERGDPLQFAREYIPTHDPEARGLSSEEINESSLALFASKCFTELCGVTSAIKYDPSLMRTHVRSFLDDGELKLPVHDDMPSEEVRVRKMLNSILPTIVPISNAEQQVDTMLKRLDDDTPIDVRPMQLHAHKHKMIHLNDDDAPPVDAESRRLLQGARLINLPSDCYRMPYNPSAGCKMRAHVWFGAPAQTDTESPTPRTRDPQPSKHEL